MRQLRALRPAVGGIAISGFGTEEDVQQSLAVGFKEHLVKPLNIAALRAAVQRIVFKSQLIRSKEGRASIERDQGFLDAHAD